MDGHPGGIELGSVARADDQDLRRIEAGDLRPGAIGFDAVEGAAEQQAELHVRGLAGRGGQRRPGILVAIDEQQPGRRSGDVGTARPARR